MRDRRSSGGTATSPLAPPALGTAAGELVQPCEAPRPQRRELPAPPREPAIAVALSGGGFRATLAGLGVLRYLADARALDHATTHEPSPDWTAAHPRPPDARLAHVPTSFDRFPVRLCDRLVHAGWWFAGATLTRHHPGLLRRPVPSWTRP